MLEELPPGLDGTAKLHEQSPFEVNDGINE